MTDNKKILIKNLVFTVAMIAITLGGSFLLSDGSQLHAKEVSQEAGNKKTTKQPPNIVFLISDDQAWGDYGFMGHPHIKTPHLDRLAKQSLTFQRGYTPDSLCRPSLTTMISGLYPHQHGIVGNDPPPLPGMKGKSKVLWRRNPAYQKQQNDYICHIDSAPRLAEMLKAKGYVSHQSGKWWEGNFKRGGFTHGMTHGDRSRGGRHGDKGLAIGRKGMKPVFDFMDNAQKQKKPFFVYYAPFMPHRPHTPPERLLKKYRDQTLTYLLQNTGQCVNGLMKPLVN